MTLKTQKPEESRQRRNAMVETYNTKERKDLVYQEHSQQPKKSRTFTEKWPASFLQGPFQA